MFKPKRCSNYLNLAQKISKKRRSYQPLPRFRPFCCAKCGLSSFSLHTVQDHRCRRRKRRNLTSEEVQKALGAGTKSGVRNWLRTLESLDYPGGYPVESLDFQLHTSLKNPHKYTQKPIPPEFKGTTSSTTNHQVVRYIPTHQHQQVGLSHKFGFLCMNCRELFHDFEAFDLHLNQKVECTRKRYDLPFMNIPLNTVKVETVNLSTEMCCMRCLDSNFQNMVVFQEHVLKCALEESWDNEE